MAKGDKELLDKLPKVMKDALKSKTQNTPPKGSRSYSTTTSMIGGSGADMAGMDLSAISASMAPTVPGAKFELPALPLPQGSNYKRRYDPVVDQFTNLLMRHGQKSVAQRV